jgi:O-antigen/teichoic acid export membrane protein
MSAESGRTRAAPRSSARLYAINATSSVASRVLQLTVLLWVNQYLLKRVDPAEYSLLPVVMSLLVVFRLVSGLFSGGLTRFFIEADARGDDEGVARITSSMLPMLVLVSAVVLVVGVAAAWHVDRLLEVEPSLVPDAQMMILMLIMTLAIELVGSAFTQGPYIRQRFVLFSAVELACEVVRLVILLVLLLGVSVEVRWVVVSSTIATVFQQLVLLIASRRMVPALRFDRRLVSLPMARRMLTFGAWTGSGAVNELVSNAGPIFILNRLSSALDVASFHLGRLPDTQLRRLLGAAGAPAQVALTSIYAQQGASALGDLYYRGGRYHMWIMLLLAAPLLVYREELTWLYAGHQYVATPVVLLALLARYPVLWASAMFGRIAIAMGHVRSYYLSLHLTQALTLVAMLVAVWYLDLGAEGAAIALSGSQILLQILVVWPLGLRLVNGSWGRFASETLWGGCLPFAVACLVCAGVGRILPMDNWWSLAIGAALGMLAYALALVAACLDPVDRKLLRRGLSWLRRRR